jgi:hypothetical protein
LSPHEVNIWHVLLTSNSVLWYVWSHATDDCAIS